MKHIKKNEPTGKARHALSTIFESKPEDKGPAQVDISSVTPKVKSFRGKEELERFALIEKPEKQVVRENDGLDYEEDIKN